MTDKVATATGGPDTGNMAQHIAGWTLVLLLAFFFTQMGMI